MPPSGAGFALVLTPDGMALECGGARVVVGKKLRNRAWYRVWASADPATGMMRVGQQPLKRAFAVDDEGEASTTAAGPFDRRGAAGVHRRGERRRSPGAALLQRQDRGAGDRGPGRLGLRPPHGHDGDRGHRTQRPARPAREPADARHEGRGVERRRARLEARAAHVCRHPLPRRRPARLRLGRRFQLHRAEGHEERRLGHAAALRAASRRHPLLRAPAGRQAAGQGLLHRLDLHLSGLHQFLARHVQRAVPPAR